MSVVRMEEHKRNFSILDNECFRNPKISFNAKGVWATAMTYPNDWFFSIDYLAKIGNCNKRQVYSYVRELIEAGYVLKIQRHKKANKRVSYSAVEYVFFEMKQTVEQMKEFEIQYHKNTPLPPEKKNGYQKQQLPEKTEENHCEKDPNSVHVDFVHARNCTLLSTIDIPSTNSPISPREISSSSVNVPVPENEKIQVVKNDDDDLSKASSGIFFTDTRDRRQYISEKDIFRHFLRLPYPTDVVKQAIERCRSLKTPVNNMVRYLESTCESIVRARMVSDRNSKDLGFKPIPMPSNVKTYDTSSLTKGLLFQ